MRLWISDDRLIIDILQWTLTHGRARDDRPTKTYINRADTGCSLEDMTGAMDDREKNIEKERVSKRERDRERESE